MGAELEEKKYSSIRWGLESDPKGGKIHNSMEVVGRFLVEVSIMRGHIGRASKGGEPAEETSLLII